MISDPAQYMAIALFLSFVVLIFTGYPVAWLMGGLAVLFTAISVLSDTYLDTFFGVDWGYSSIVIERIYAVMNNWVLVALPMFVFMGIMMDKSGIAEDLMTDLAKLFGRVRGGLAITVVAIGVLLAASTGIIGAAVVLLAILGIPLMLKHHYDAALACGVVCATGTLGILIPPSIMLVLMADQIRVSVGDLFMGAMLPGLMLGGLYGLFILIYAWLRPSAAPAPKDAEPVTLGLFLNVLKSTIPPALLIVAVLGSIFFGIATPTEASGVGALGATLLALLRGRLNFSGLQEVLLGTMKTTSYIFALFVGATAFALVLRGFGGDELIEDALTSLPFGPDGIVVVILFVAFLLGFVLDWIEITLILLPLIAPVLVGLDVDLIWFAVLFAVTLQTSFITPPVGFALFYMKGVAPKGVTTLTIYRGIIPFMLIQLLAVLLIYVFPRLATWLPEVAYGL
ncbi:TRAP transporter large permease subunit [Defluviimonas aestuarii]|uniref:TRAP transporter large permease n=1 Tax=Albidovulum aestuarii TaxID=1130726 RepID=UPI00249B5446|nr:TRAP transporter large permease subunit [Defluviimonas aestuarii]MDI3337708.1 TRAP transporter large permease subunit [Defluviimonas aestuarii]